MVFLATLFYFQIFRNIIFRKHFWDRFRSNFFALRCIAFEIIVGNQRRSTRRARRERREASIFRRLPRDFSSLCTSPSARRCRSRELSSVSPLCPPKCSVDPFSRSATAHIFYAGEGRPGRAREITVDRYTDARFKSDGPFCETCEC